MTRDERRETISCGMIVLRSPSFVITVLLFCSCFSLNIAHASTSSAEHSTLIAPLLWRAGGGDNDSFKKALLSKASLAEDGSVVSSGSGSVCELETPYATENPVNRVSATWTFTGQVTLEVNATGKEPKVALVACMRKLLVILNAMVKSNQPWREINKTAAAV